MLALVVALAAAAAAAPNALPMPNGYQEAFSFLDDHVGALSRFRASIGGQEELGKIQSALREFNDGQEPLPELQNAVPFNAELSGPPTIADINRPIAAYLYGGDIMLAPSSITGRSKRGAPVITAVLWDKTRPIAYSFNADIDDAARTSIRTATKNIAENTCINFQENGSGPQLVFHRGGGCWSLIGRTNETKQLVSIDNGCEKIAIVSHEIAHALGIHHTQTRFDRDSFVTVDLSAIAPYYMHNYDKQTAAANDNFGVPYEYGSAMHYGAADFTFNGTRIMTAKKPDYNKALGQTRYMTFNDYKLINLLYKCAATCPKKITCQNGGYQSSRKCDTCVCSDYFTGDLCQLKKNDIALTAAAPTQTTKFSQPMNPSLFNTANFNKWEMFGKDTARTITAPAGRKIKVTIDKLSALGGSFGCFTLNCPYVGLEFADTMDGDVSSVGKIFCCPADAGTSFISRSNVLGYKAFAGPGTPFELQVTYTLV